MGRKRAERGRFQFSRILVGRRDQLHSTQMKKQTKPKFPCPHNWAWPSWQSTRAPKKVKIAPTVLSASGTIAINGQIILVDGTVDDWSVFVFPQQFRTPPEPGSEGDNALMGVRVYTDPLPARGGWSVRGAVTWRRGLHWQPEDDWTSNSIPVVAYLVVRARLP